jgi:short-subunit dehydrogenase involved in D-alanine esterification of teichoic acids
MNQFTNKADVVTGGSGGIGLAAAPRANELANKGAGSSATQDYLNSGRPVSGLIPHGRWRCN